MYKVLLVDDERMILDGISVIVDWSSHQTELIGKAMNGMEAYDFISENETDIVITDITMPGLDGIELVKKAKTEYPDIKWIFLSGYNEFEYARQAMRYGVKHYLLKPCNENNIAEALKEVVKEKQEEEKALTYMKVMEEEVTKNSLSEQEEIVRQFFLYQQLTDATDKKMKSLIEQVYASETFYFWYIDMDGIVSYDQITEVVESIKIRWDESEVITTFIENKILIMMPKTISEKEVYDFLDAYSSAFKNGYSVVSTECYTKDTLKNVPKLEDIIQQLFYLPAYSVVNYKNWMSFYENLNADIEMDLDKLLYYLKKNQQAEALNYVKMFVNQLEVDKISPKTTRGYFIQIYLLLMSKHSRYSTEDRIQAIGKLEDFQHITEFITFFKDLFSRMVDQVEHPKKYPKVISQMLECINEEIENPELSLQWLANNCLYMNADYLGKTFKKETGHRFSSYVTNARINRAVEIIESEQDIKVFELAERLGFGNNPQYFSQLFKRMKGFTPSEIMKTNDSE
ncbi:response regulator [Gracilibacillus kekensis]|uniref:Two-component system, response regulator YesN n=1 Tax=Gracilibacillus kekensis TaxID=1027249 RepID=A0A1M7MT97_9BACI|nr:response regulator [Gracilibacillus kekensis]SHM94239.1 two-component system, response regulator YesN [Gracilibacillus kekensis]